MKCPKCQADVSDSADRCFHCGHTLRSSTTLIRGSLIGERYEVQALLGKGGMVQPAPDVFDDGYDHAAFIRTSLAGDGSIWSISAWHKLMNAMQAGGKGDETGWEVYEESRRGGAIIATAHEHSYSRTHLMSSMEGLTVASTAEPLVLAADDPATGADEGRSFAFVSGLGASSIRDQERTGDWWASVYTSTQGAEDGALFATFHVNGDPRLAHFYFMDAKCTRSCSRTHLVRCGGAALLQRVRSPPATRLHVRRRDPDLHSSFIGWQTDHDLW